MKVNWDYEGELPEKLFITGNKEEVITPEKIINYLKYKTHTKSFVDCLIVLESLRQDTKDGFSLLPRPQEIYSEGKLRAKNAIEEKRKKIKEEQEVI